MVIHDFTVLPTSRHHDRHFPRSDNLQGCGTAVTDNKRGLLHQLLKFLTQEERPSSTVDRDESRLMSHLHQHRTPVKHTSSGQSVHRLNQASKPLRSAADCYEDHSKTPP